MKKLKLIFSLLISLFCLASTNFAMAAGVNALVEESQLPKISDSENEYWYYIQFTNGGWVIEDKGADAEVKTAAYVLDNEAQLWKITGSLDNCQFVNKNGNYLVYQDKVKASKDPDANGFKIVSTSTEGVFEIQHPTTSTSKGFNMFKGAGEGKSITLYDSGDSGNSLKFTPLPVFPNISDSENEFWYYIQFTNGNWVIEDKGVGADVKTAECIPNGNAQLWKITGSPNNCQFINRNGNYLVYQSNIKTSKEPDAKGFKIVPAGAEDVYEIQHPTTSTSKGFNMNGGAGKNKNIALWNSGDSGNSLTFILLDDLLKELPPAEFAIEEYVATAPEEKLTLWYTKPATATGVANPWMEYSLPLGNGQLGASLFGGVARDEILFNDKTLWSGGPNEYGYYLPFGSVYIDDISGEFESSPVKKYYRDLNLKTATGTVKYENADGVKFTRQYIASNPDKAIVSRIAASESGKLNLRITMRGGKPTIAAKTKYSDGYAQFTGKLQTVSYNATMKVVPVGGEISTSTDGITVKNADEVLVILVASTDFVGNDASHVNGNAANLPAENKAQADAVAEKGWDAVYAAHVADHQKFFTRVQLELDGVKNNLPTNELIVEYNAAKGARNLMLEQLYYNYGRYLSIASSRGADLPNNLQGIWNNTCTPPWHSDIHANINVQMNYWPVSAGNLNEMYEPFLNYIINEAAQPEWQKRAELAGEKRGWTCLTENNIFGGISGFAPNYVIANAWYVTHLWQHYRYTLDKEFLAKAFPAMLGAAQFWADRMVLAEDGTYECPNEYSPEHGPGSENAVAHAQQIAWEALDNTLKAAKILGGVAAGIITQEDYDLILDRFTKMDKGLATENYDGSWGETYNGVAKDELILREWKYSKFTASTDRGHRHMSHLMALFPFGQLTPASEFFEPAINSMKLRGDESTGWSMGWKINLWARALMGDRSHAILRKALKHSTTYGTDQSQGGIYYNLYDSHAPFQIDGNFGATSGVNEMLLQSHTDVIDILPALPSEWSKGSVKGLKAVGDFTIDIEWVGNQAKRVVITNNQGQPCYVKCKELAAATVTVNGATVTLGEEQTVNGLPCYKIESAAGDEIVIDLSSVKQQNKVALENLIEETKNLINDCYDYYKTEVALQTTDKTGAYYVSTNAQEDQEGPIKNLVDGNNDTHFHSEYTSNVGAKHYIEIALGSGNEISSFKFKYVTRKTDTNFPKTIEVQGSINGEDFEVIETITDLPVGNSSSNMFFTSNVIDGEKSYSHLRFVVTENNSGKSEAGGNPFFHMAEFGLIPKSDDFENNYPGATELPTIIDEARAAIAVAKEDLAKEQTIAEYETSLATMRVAYDKLKDAMYIPVAEIILDKSEANMEKGKTMTLIATVTPTGTTESNITWSSSLNSVATVKNGIVTALSAGTTVISAKVGDKIATCTVTVFIPVKSVTLNNTTADLTIGETIKLKATVNPIDTTDGAVVWSTSDANIATVENGVVTAVAIGTATITAKVGDKQATCTIRVIIPVESVSLNLSETNVYIGDTLTLEATVNPIDATDSAVTWSTSDANIATVKDGVVTAIAAGTATITAEAGGQKATCVVKVEVPEGIDEIIANDKVVIYDLKGNRIADKKEMKQGVYIVNGVKHVVE